MFVEITPTKTYATKENAQKAFEKKFGKTAVVYTVLQSGDRFFPVAFGETAIQHGVHFHFNIVAYN